VEVRPIIGQVDDLTREIRDRAEKRERILVTTLTKRMAEDLSEHFKENNVRAEYLHSEVQTLDRVGILDNLRKGEFDVLVGVNLLREGLDLPEVSLVAILDADKEGFLRSEVSLIQTIGRAARNVRGKVILYADNITGSMKRAISETNRRRKMQIAYNQKHHITPKTIQKAIQTIIDHELRPEVTPEYINIENLEDIPRIIRIKTEEMKKAAKELRFEEAAILRDEIVQLKRLKFK
jgi:excinuclease ABC subunit B